jgi:hypothetical protein
VVGWRSGLAWQSLTASLGASVHALPASCLQAVFEHPEQQAPLTALLGELAGNGAVSQTQLGMGFSRVRAALDDYLLDYPQCGQQLGAMEAAGSAAGWLP